MRNLSMLCSTRTTSYALILMIMVTGLQCTNSNSVHPIEENLQTESIKIGVPIHREYNGEIIHTNRFLNFETDKICQSWALDSQADEHSSKTHYHYYAASDLDFKSTTTKLGLSWKEVGPTLDAESVEASCKAGENGETISITSENLTPYKDIYLRVAYYFYQ